MQVLLVWWCIIVKMRTFSLKAANPAARRCPAASWRCFFVGMRACSQETAVKEEPCVLDKAAQLPRL